MNDAEDSLMSFEIREKYLFVILTLILFIFNDYQS